MSEALLGLTGGGFVSCCCVRVGPGASVTVANAGHVTPYSTLLAIGERMTLEFGFDPTRDISAGPAREIAASARAWGQSDDTTVVTIRAN